MDTIAHHKARPLQSNIDFSDARLKHVMDGYEDMKTMLKNWDGGIQAKPETEALWFYVQQHAMGLAERSLDNDEPMGDYEEFITAYHKDIQRKTMRMFYYLLLICTRESRHASGTAGKQKVWDKHPAMKDFHNTYVQDSSAESAIKAICDNAPDVSLGEYTEYLVRMFTYPSYSSGYGGEAWKGIAEPLRDFVHGKITAEILMDTAFTLEHNNGSMFNKGMLYHTYSGSAIQKILDVQRSGQIPQLIAHHYSDLNKYIDQQMIDYVNAFSKLESGFTGRVDWNVVVDIDGDAIYTKEMAAQNAGGGFAGKIAQMKAAAKEKAAKLKAAAAAAALLKGSVEIMPNLFVPKGKRSQE